ncbi:MAG: hypothetical protein QOI11_2508 [Candidatus Eremiobacteraeota bacterium]|jgi:hypothetical protein|nr:hypothetical protein [Candidatus Eremiobacteraeota bacterium]
MNIARASTVAFACVVLGAAAAACSGSFGQGTGIPQPLGSLAGSGVASPTPPATTSSVIVTYGDSAAFQNLPEVGGYSGAIALPTAPPPGTATAAPAAKGRRGKGNPSPEAAPTPESIAIGASLSTVKPEDGPDLNFESGKGRKRKTREHPARALVYVKLLPTHDITLESYPRIALDVPREVASQYRDGEFGLALWNAGEKESRYRLAVAERDSASPPPIVRPSSAPRAVATASTTPTPAASGSPGARPSPSGSAVPGALGGPNGPLPQASATLPPQRILFASTAAPLKMVANRPLIFALYALPHPSATPAPKGAGSAAPAAKGSGAPAPAASGAASAGSGVPAASVTPAPKAS